MVFTRQTKMGKFHQNNDTEGQKDSSSSEKENSKSDTSSDTQNEDEEQESLKSTKYLPEDSEKTDTSYDKKMTGKRSDKDTSLESSPNPSESDVTDSSVLNRSLQGGEYDDTDRVPFSELLENHSKQFVWGFKFGEVNRRMAERNMKIAKDKTLKETNEMANGSESKEKTTAVEAGGSKATTASEKDHKTPHSGKRMKVCGLKRPFGSTDNDQPKEMRSIPLPMKKCFDNIEIWNYMVSREEAAVHLRNPRLFHDFRTVTPRMRAILLDWLMEVSEVYHLRRVTYYLSVDYFDRFLTIRPDIPKNQLQLVGITCLYIAAKVEEIYPPNLAEFAYVCDGACQAQEMISCELLILNTLGWGTSATTPSDWLNVYLQMLYKYDDFMNSPNLRVDFTQEFMFPCYSSYQFTRTSQLIDLFSLDPGFLRFRYSTIAASAVYYMYGKEVTFIVSGIPWEELKDCIEYMSVFYKVIKDAPDPRLRSCLGGPQPEEPAQINIIPPQNNLLNRNENHSYQTHVANMKYFEQASILRLAILTGRLQQIEAEAGLRGQNSTAPNKGASPESPSKKGCKQADEPAKTATTTTPSNADQNEQPQPSTSKCGIFTTPSTSQGITVPTQTPINNQTACSTDDNSSSSSSTSVPVASDKCLPTHRINDESEFVEQNPQLPIDYDWETMSQNIAGPSRKEDGAQPPLEESPDEMLNFDEILEMILQGDKPDDE